MSLPGGIYGVSLSVSSAPVVLEWEIMATHSIFPNVGVSPVLSLPLQGLLQRVPVVPPLVSMVRLLPLPCVPPDPSPPLLSLHLILGRALK